jgi:hypothetical protein
MNLNEAAEFLLELRRRNEMPLDEDEFYLLEEIAERLKEIHKVVNEDIC